MARQSSKYSEDVYKYVVSSLQTLDNTGDLSIQNSLECGL